MPMLLARLTILIRAKMLASLLAVVIFYSLSGWAGEPIKITEGNESTDVRSRIGAEDPFSKAFEIRKGGGGGDGGGSLLPVAPPPSSKSMNRSERTEEKNWLLNQDKADQDKTLMEIFKVRDYSFEGREKKSKNSFENNWGDQEKDGKFNSTSGRFEDKLSGNDYTSFNKRDRSPFRDRDDASSGPRQINSGSEDDYDHSPFEPGKELFPGMQSGLTGNSLSPGGPDRMMGMPTFGSISQTRGTDKSSSSDFDKLLGGRKFMVDQIGSSINFQTDPTRREINPIVGRALDNSGSSLSSRLSGPVDAGQSPTSGRFGPLDSLSSRMLGTVTPSIHSATPAPSTPVFQPRPPVLEMPRRKF